MCRGNGCEYVYAASVYCASSLFLCADATSRACKPAFCLRAAAHTLATGL